MNAWQRDVGPLSVEASQQVSVCASRAMWVLPLRRTNRHGGQVGSARSGGLQCTESHVPLSPNRGWSGYIHLASRLLLYVSSFLVIGRVGLVVVFLLLWPILFVRWAAHLSAAPNSSKPLAVCRSKNCKHNMLYTEKDPFLLQYR